MTEAVKKKFRIEVIGWNVGLHIHTTQGLKFFCSWHRSNCPGKPFCLMLELNLFYAGQISTKYLLHQSSIKAPPPPRATLVLKIKKTSC